MQQLGDNYKTHKSVQVAQMDCTEGNNQAYCLKLGVGSYPTIKVFNYATHKGKKLKGDEYNGERTFKAMKRFIQTKLGGRECSVRDLTACDEDELAFIKESEQMTGTTRKTILAELDAEMAEMRKEFNPRGLQMKQELKKLQAEGVPEERLNQIRESQSAETQAYKMEMHKLKVKIDMYKMGRDSRFYFVLQITSDDEFQDHCGSRTCMIAFLPPLSDGGEKVRKANLAILQSVSDSARKEGRKLGVMWVQGGDQPAVEKDMGLKPEYPVAAAMNMQKKKFAVHDGKFSENPIDDFLSNLIDGNIDLKEIKLKWETTEAWKPTKEEL